MNSPSIMTLAKNGTSIFAGTFGNGVYVSSNNGASWSPTSSGFSGAVVSKILAHNGYLIAGTFGGGVFTSSDNGVSWTPSIATPFGATYDMVGYNNFLFAGTSGGVKISNDYGYTWSNVNSISQFNSVMSLAIHDGYLFAGTWDKSVWKTVLAPLVGADEISNLVNFNLYPNPANNVLSIDINGRPEQANIITLFNAYGQIVYSTRVYSSEKVSIDISHLPSGMYLTQLQSKEGRSTGKFIVED
ncbi:MAG: T9SS type A sorting domain-containing protein [Bacteroidetes bacterium]|nr:T9SS type A sorting domain-containing protein [Bacteroidota bacterium]